MANKAVYLRSTGDFSSGLANLAVSCKVGHLTLGHLQPARSKCRLIQSLNKFSAVAAEIGRLSCCLV